MKKIILVIVTTALCSIFGYFIFKQIRQLPRVAGTYISRLDKQTIFFPNNSDFSYYYLANPSTTISEKRPWDNTLATYTINEDSLNERFDYIPIKPNGVLRIITLGDSFTFGHYINTEENWTEILEDILAKNPICKQIHKIEVINLGERGFDIPYTTKKYTDIGQKYHPDFLIWLESGTGFTRYNELMRPYIEKCEIEASSVSATYTQDITRCWVQSEKLMMQQYSEKTIRSQLSIWLDRFLSVRSNTPVIFATFHSTPDGDKNILREKQKNNAYVHFTDEISDIYSQDGVFPDGHPNQKGHRIMADDIYRYLFKNRQSLFQCN